MDYPSWIAVDWGTSNVRAWAMDDDCAVLDEAKSEDGVGQMAGRDFEDALLRLIEPWLGRRSRPVVICGMAGARNGWMEAPYRTVPCAPPVEDALSVPTRDARLNVRLVPGIKQAVPVDVMRGEETQIAGYLARHQNFDGVLCLPGTHSKWAHISAGEVVSFRTFMTGDVYAALSNHSILSATISGVPSSDADAFTAAVAEILSKPEALGSSLFSIRAASLLEGQSPETGASRLSGILIGAELAASKPYWLGQQVAIIGAPELAEHYKSALASLGVQAQTVSAREMTLAGLGATRHATERTTA